METAKLKRFATEARINLMDGVRRKLHLLGFDKNGSFIGDEPELIQNATIVKIRGNGEVYPESFYKQWTTLRDRISERGVYEVVEEGAYTWFNRLMAIRILTMNGLCEPILRLDGSVGLPLLLSAARMGRVPEMSAQEKDRLDVLMDDDTRAYDQFSLLLTAWCHANPCINACFGSINDYVELLLPDNIMRPDGFLAKLNDTPFISEEDYKSAELIGWLYQFYISDRKDEVFAKKGKVEADEIPAATQIFTPNWIVKYMVENTILPQVDATDDILDNAKYLVKVEGADKRKVELEDLKVADFACGSGHILNECFDLLFELYRSEAYSRREAVELIFTKNLIGIDIDLRAKQLATFALLLKACQRDASFADAHCVPRVLTVPELTAILKTSKYEDEDGGHGKHIKHVFFQDSVTDEVANELENAFSLLKDADSLGSIIKFGPSASASRAISETAEYWRGKDALNRPEFVNDLLPAIDFIDALTDSYDAIVMNPPYMPTSRVDMLKDYAVKTYPDSKTDLFSVFMDVCIDRLKDGGKYGMINMQSWMFLSSFEALRKKIIENQHIDSLLHLGPRTFDELSGEVVQNAAFVIAKEQPESAGIYYRLIDGKSCTAKQDMFLSGDNHYVVADQKQFEQIPGAPIAYQIGGNVLSLFEHNPNLDEAKCVFRIGLMTGDNKRFLRIWHETSVKNIYFDCSNANESEKSDKMWYPINSGGSYRKWYGNQETVANWLHNGAEMKADAIIRNGGKHWSRYIVGIDRYYEVGISWNAISSGKICVRAFGNGFLIGHSSVCGYCEDNNYIMSLLNSPVSSMILEILSPTVNFGSTQVNKIPLIIGNQKSINILSKECISISKQDWDAHETSWDFQINPLVFSIYDNGWGKLENSVGDYEQTWEHRFRQLHANEEELNQQFIEIYGLQDELTPHVPLDEVTILQQGEVKIEDGKLVWQRDVIIKQLISYIVGCYMGRYRLDRVHETGLHIAHPNPSEEELLPYNFSFTHDGIFSIDPDSIIPVLPQGAPFYDNLYNYVEQFVKMVWEDDDLQENLNFIEKCLGKPLNDYLMKDFWKYHKKMYQNRPIYWEFASKKGAFRALVYAHRMDKFTVEVLRSKYLLPYIGFIERKIANLDARSAELSTAERRELDNLRNKTLPELREYADRVEVVALKNIAFDLDDGIIKNHALFGDIVTKLK